MPESIVLGLKLAGIGMGIVFVVLAVISFIIGLIRRIDDHWQKREVMESEAALTKTPNIDDITLILISAAVATILQGRHRIHRIRRVEPGDSTRSPWSIQGRTILLGSHVFQKKKD